MKHTTRWIASFSALLLTLGGAAAGQSSPTQQSPSAGQSEPAKKMVVTGCLQPADPATAALATATAAGATAQFILADASTTSVAPAGAGAVANPSGSSGVTSATPQATGTSGTSAASKSSYVLLTDDVEQLRTHVNHQVEITGHLEMAGRDAISGRASAQPAISSGTPPTGSQAGRQGADTGQRLRVDAVRMITASCSQG